MCIVLVAVYIHLPETKWKNKFLALINILVNIKQALWLVDSWSRAPDQIQMYPNRDIIAYLLPARRMQQHGFALWLSERKHKYLTKQ